MNGPQDTAPTGTAPILSRSGRRQRARVSMPILVEINGYFFESRDWSSGGFSLNNDGPEIPLSNEITLRLHFELRGERFFAEVSARVIRTRGSHARAFQFIDDRDGNTALLENVARLWLSEGARLSEGGQLTQQSAARDVVPAAAAAPALPALRQPAPLRISLPARVRSYALIAAGAGVAISALGYLVASRTTVYSDYAAVTGDLQVVRAPAEGLLVGSALQAGAVLHSGEVIGRLQPVVTPMVLGAAKTALQLAQAKVNQQQDLLDSATAGYGGFVQYARHALADASASRQMMTDQLAAEQRVYDRLRMLAENGTVAPLRADQELVNLRTQQHAQSLALADEAAARQRLDDATRGRFVTDGRSTQLAPSDIARDLKVTMAERDSAAAALAALSTTTQLISPCDCTVATVVVPDQTFVQIGNPIANLAVARPGDTQVDALVPSGLMSFLHSGQKVRVFLSDRTDAEAGTVTTLNYNPVNTGRVGLPDTLRTLGNYGLVTVALHDAGAVPVGTPAVLNAPVAWSMLLRNLPGFNTLAGGPR